MDDTVATASLLRHDVKIVTEKGHSEEDVLLTGFQTFLGEIIVMLDPDESADSASFLVPL